MKTKKLLAMFFPSHIILTNITDIGSLKQILITLFGGPVYVTSFSKEETITDESLNVDVHVLLIPREEELSTTFLARFFNKRKKPMLCIEDPALKSFVEDGDAHLPPYIQRIEYSPTSIQNEIVRASDTISHTPELFKAPEG